MLPASQTDIMMLVLWDTHRAAMAALVDYTCSESHKHDKDNSIHVHVPTICAAKGCVEDQLYGQLLETPLADQSYSKDAY